MVRSRKVESNIEPLSSTDGPLAYCRAEAGPRSTGKTMREWCEYAAVWVILKGLGLLPRTLAREFAAGVVRVLYAVSARLRRTAEVNLRIAFPEWSDAQRKAVVRGVLRNLGWMAVEFALFPIYSRENIRQSIVIDTN